ncbi:hypothetical protein Desku_0922 [Desulfofundulus kuznetsovii DSM 6115]|uniref:Uncharacterized protein n=1 Tax=Desulfofundulus kuznetsovii (strain DSM 6115 / VKM B-1805 / 17) TaxID=760568 RepID=A0AAU8P9J9_DESK7|nr:hypothetical protein Desku_0922 [Desulfofundulus kuznetsovii DSM 6115]
MLQTTWNTVCNAVANLPGNWDGLEPVKEDFPVALRPLEDVPGYLEVTTPSGDTILYLPDGRGSGSLQDWIPEEDWPENWGIQNREWLAPADRGWRLEYRVPAL